MKHDQLTAAIDDAKIGDQFSLSDYKQRLAAYQIAKSLGKRVKITENGLGAWIMTVISEGGPRWAGGLKREISRAHSLAQEAGIDVNPGQVKNILAHMKMGTATKIERPHGPYDEYLLELPPPINETYRIRWNAETETIAAFLPDRPAPEIEDDDQAAG